MSTIRKSPTQSATLYKVGTKKKGNDGNTWIIVENKNNVKRWQLYKKITEKKENIIKPTVDVPKIKETSYKMISAIDLYDIPKIKKNNWKKWLENLTFEQKKYIDKVRNSYKSTYQSRFISNLSELKFGTKRYRERNRYYSY